MKTRRVWIATVSSLALLGVVFLILGLVRPTSPSIPVRAGEFEDSIPQKRVQELISLAFPSFAKASEGRPRVAGAKTPFKVTHQSPEQTADFAFNALGSIWEANLPEGDKVAFAVRFKEESGSWSDWRAIEEEDDLKEDPPPGIHYGRLISAGDALQFQYRAVFTLMSAKQVPSVSKIKLVYIDSRGKAKARGRSVGTVLGDALLAVRSSLSLESVLLRKIRSFLEFDSYEVSADTPSADVPVINRASWGAKESYRFDKNGDEIWTRSYRPIEKMIVHHTVFNDPDPKTVVRAIYYYHAVTLGFGDIGYNFLIDRAGNIYEGRYGGDGVVAGHARRYNWGSVGVAVLGDFRYDSVNNPIRNALDKVAVWKFTKHGVDPTLNTYFIDRTLPSVFEHGKVLPTACAGTNLNNYVPTLKSHARFMPQEILVKFRGGVSDGQISGFAGKLSLTEVSRHQNSIRRFRFGNGRTVGQVLSAASKEMIVAYARANYIRQMTLTPDDPEFVNQWSLTQIKASEAWDISPGGDSTVTVAVLDTGVAYENYSDIRGVYAQATDFGGTTFVPGYDFINNDGHANDDHGHGTAVASILAATTNNATGIAGIAYAAKIMPVKVLDQYGAGTDVTIADGIYWAVDNGAKVLNLSLGSVDHSPILKEAVDYVIKVKGAVVVAAAGNQGRESLLYPARYLDVVAVGASNMNGNRAWYSNYGEGLDLLAPGGDLKADLDGNGTADGILFEMIKKVQNPKDFTNFEFRLGHGTSFATPHVSATIAIMVVRGTIWPESLERFIKMSVLNMPVVVNKANPVPPHPNGVLLRAGSTPAVYSFESGVRRLVPNRSVFLERYGDWGKVASVSPYTVGTYPQDSQIGYPDGTLLKGSARTVYVLERGKRRGFASRAIFEGLGYKWENIILLSDAELGKYPAGDSISSLKHPDGTLMRRSSTSAAVYYLENGKRRLITSRAAFLSFGFEWEDVLVTGKFFANYPESSPLLYGDGTLLRGSTATVYVVSEGKLRPIASRETFADLGFRWDKVLSISNDWLSQFVIGEVLY